jgi:hypothetical protein
MMWAAASTAGAVTFTGYGIALPTGETLITDFSNAWAMNLSGDGLFQTGSYSFSAAPALNASTRDPNQYLRARCTELDALPQSAGFFIGEAVALRRL